VDGLVHSSLKGSKPDYINSLNFWSGWIGLLLPGREQRRDSYGLFYFKFGSTPYPHGEQNN